MYNTLKIEVFVFALTFVQRLRNNFLMEIAISSSSLLHYSMSNKEVVNYFSKLKTGTDDLFVCTCGKTRKQDRKRGHGNLMEHIKSEHTNYLQEVRNANISVLSPTTTSHKAQNNSSWVDWFCDGLPYNFCENPTTRKYTNFDPIAASTF